MTLDPHLRWFRELDTDFFQFLVEKIINSDGFFLGITWMEGSDSKSVALPYNSFEEMNTQYLEADENFCLEVKDDYHLFNHSEN